MVGGAANWYTFDRNITSTTDNISTLRNVDTHWQPLELTSLGLTKAQQRYVQMDLDVFFNHRCP